MAFVGRNPRGPVPTELLNMEDFFRVGHLYSVVILTLGPFFTCFGGPFYSTPNNCGNAH